MKAFDNGMLGYSHTFSIPHVHIDNAVRAI